MRKSKKIFNTNKKENTKAKIFKLVFNLFPSYRRSGGRVCFLSSDWKEIHVKLGLNWSTRNYVGTVFGGSIYGSIDPIFMFQLINILGKNYVVWDKSASIKFIRPIKKTVYAQFLISEDLIHEIETTVKNEKKHIIHLPVTYVDENGIVHAEASKTIYIADKDYYKDRKKTKS